MIRLSSWRSSQRQSIPTTSYNPVPCITLVSGKQNLPEDLHMFDVQSSIPYLKSEPQKYGAL